MQRDPEECLQSTTDQHCLVESSPPETSRVEGNRDQAVGLEIRSLPSVADFSEFRQGKSEALKTPELEVAQDIPKAAPVLPECAGAIELGRAGSTTGTDAVDFEQVTRDLNAAVVAGSPRTRRQPSEATTAQRSQIVLEDPFAANDARLRRENGLDQPHGGRSETSHAYKNVSGW